MVVVTTLTGGDVDAVGANVAVVDEVLVLLVLPDVSGWLSVCISRMSLRRRRGVACASLRVVVVSILTAVPMRTPYLLHVHGQFMVTVAWLTSLAVLHTFQWSCICWHVCVPHILQEDSADVAQPWFVASAKVLAAPVVLPVVLSTVGVLMVVVVGGVSLVDVVMLAVLMVVAVGGVGMAGVVMLVVVTVVAANSVAVMVVVAGRFVQRYVSAPVCVMFLQPLSWPSASRR